ncbi:MAG TPA: glycosyltransferase family 4 protein [Marmoricola sp.]|nr:glycosyltransferase family 4 protein [Marmoricola sp.]
MISFVWEPGIPLPAGTGGSENYTIGHVREFNRRGIAAQVVTVGVGTADGREQFSDIPFRALDHAGEVSDLDGTVIFVTEFPSIATRKPAYQILHIPPPRQRAAGERIRAQTRDRFLIATSQFAARLWSEFLDVDPATINIVYPFAEPCFGREVRPGTDGELIRILYAGRLSPEKGIYTLLATLHSEHLVDDARLRFTATTAGDDKPQGAIIRLLLEAHPGISLVASRRTPQAMASLMAAHDIVVIPSNSQYWHETFGIVSIEAQHAGCRVIASDDGGLPETDCGAMTLVVPDDADALAEAIQQVIALGSVSERTRSLASSEFTVGASVDELIAVLSAPLPRTPAQVVADLEELVVLDSAPTRPQTVAAAIAPQDSLT